MRAVRIVAIGSPVQDCELPDPVPGPGEVLVRVRAAGICHSDVHYRAGTSPVGYVPITPGHEVAGVVERVGPGVDEYAPGARVCLHYLVTCGGCEYCIRGTEQFCTAGRMIGKHAEGGYAELIVVPARSVVRLPEALPFEHGAVLMCSSATAFHALRKARLGVGETVAVIGAGGLGLSAVQLSRAIGASRVYAVDVNPERLCQAEELGAVPVDGRAGDPARRVRELTGGAGVDVAVEMIGTPGTMRQAVAMLAVFGRAALVGITDRSFEVDSYREIIGREAEVIGVSDHLRTELPVLLDMAARGALDLARVVTRRVPLEARAINEVMDALAENRGASRTVIVPGPWMA
jgi:2-desacetyl-2-hydroxyethyl bacteriochlorophyllide A dehydrogenase